MNTEKKVWKGPKSYISWSQIRLWLENKQAYRNRYYRGVKEFSSKYMIFGSEIAKGLENKTISIPKLIQYPKQEYQINIEIEGVPVFGYIDQYDAENFKFREIKTGMMKPDGSPRWTDEDVKKHGQLDLYSLMIQIKHGIVCDECNLDWLKTQNKKKTLIDAFGNTLECKSNELELSGEVISFSRIITQEERDAMKKLVLEVAWAIHDDYEKFNSLAQP